MRFRCRPRYGENGFEGYEIEEISPDLPYYDDESSTPEGAKKILVTRLQRKVCELAASLEEYKRRLMLARKAQEL